MTLEAKLAEIQGILTPEQFSGEAAVLLRIVFPILRELNWDTDNPMVVRTEYTAGKGGVDFALCERLGNPKVFIKVKGLGGEMEDAVEQAMRYAYRARVRIVVLTDGATWSFYLPSGESSSYKERQVFKLDILKQSPQESSKSLQFYLEESRVISGEALKSALRELGDRRRLEKARGAIPGAWRDIFEASESDESFNLLVIVLADRVESEVGVRPGDNDVVNFLRSLQRQEGPVFPPPPPPLEDGELVVRNGELVILGESFRYRTAIKAMVVVFNELERRKPGFLQRFYEDRRNHGRTRRIIAQDPRELYDRADLEKFHKQLDYGNWVISTNHNRPATGKNIRFAAEVAGLRDIIINFEGKQDSAQLLSGADDEQVQRNGNEGEPVGRAIVKVVIDGKSFCWQDQSDAMATVFRELQKRDRNFCQRFYEQPWNQRGEGRRYLGRNKVELFGDSDAQRSYRKISDDWVISINYAWEVAGGKSRKKDIIQFAANVAGLKLKFKKDISGKGIIVNLNTS